MRTKQLLTTMLIFMASFAFAQNDNCTGTLTESSDGAPFVDGFTYFFNTQGDEVTATFELLDPVDGLVGFYQTLNPDFQEIGPVFPEPGTQVLTETFSGFSDGDTFTVLIKFAYAGNFSTSDTLTYTVGDNCGIVINDPVDLPVTFDDNVDYDLVDFGGNATSILQVDPTDPANTVAQTIRTAGSEVFAGTTIGGNSGGFANPIPFDNANTGMSVRVYSPAAGIPVRLKVEDSVNPGIFAEAEVLTTTSNAWETLTYDFVADAVPGSPALNLGNAYQKASIFFNFGADPATTPEQTYFWDDVEFAPGVGGISQIDLPIDFEDATADYGLTDFGGNASSIVTDPEDAGNTVVQSIRTAGSEVFAGTTVGQPLGLENPVPFDFDNTGMSVRVWSPEAGIPVRLKVEQVGNPAIFVETEVSTTTAMAWETLEFDFSSPAAGGLDLNQDYNLVTIFFNFGQDPATSVEQIYFWDDVQFAPGVGGFTPIELPITFDETEVTIGLSDFGGNASSIIEDPEEAGNNVVQSIRTAGALSFAGTTVPAQGLTTPIPFEAGSTTMSMRVWSPEVGVPVLFKVENANNTISSEVQVSTTTSGEWETLVFDLANSQTAPLDFGVNYVRISIFFNFGLEAGPEQIYLWDDVAFGDGSGNVPCETPYPQVDGLSFSNVSGGVALSWNPIPGSIGCQLQVGTSFQDVQTVTVFGENASSFFVPGNFVNVGQTYSWRVRCGCSTNPLVAGPYSAISQFTYLGLGLTTETETRLSAFPNPSDGNAFISLNTDTETDQGIIEVYDMSGRLVESVYSGSVAANQEIRFEFNGSHLPEGIYVIRYTTAEETITEKMMISK